jgi:acetyltransferase-like isoleucine patch superfamily enzyme
VEGHEWRPGIAAQAMVNDRPTRTYASKSRLLGPLRLWLRATARLRAAFARLYAHAWLSHQIRSVLPASVVLLGKVSVEGTGNVHVGENCYFYPGVYFETQGNGRIEIGDDVVISSGAHLVAMDSVVVGSGSMIGEYASLRDANHHRAEGIALRWAGHTAKPIVLGTEVWIGRGVAVLGGVSIGEGATVGANAVVTSDVLPRTTVAGVPARPIASKERTSNPKSAPPDVL